MTIREMMNLLDARVLSGIERLDQDVESAFSSDMMSDVLALAGECSVLITGLCNPQVIRTAEMLDITCVIFVRGKTPNSNMLTLAKDQGMVILATSHYMFTTCGILYEHGLQGGVR